VVAILALISAAFIVAVAGPPPLQRFVEITSTDEKIARAALNDIASQWKDQYAAMLLDVVRLFPTPRVEGPADSQFLSDEEDRRASARIQPGDLPPVREPGSPVRRLLIAFLEKQTGQRFGDDIDRWREWSWKLADDPHPEYAAFKGIVYQNIDPRMRAFFPAGARSTIRLDEIDWGGVRVNGIPPLRYPKTIDAPVARYLADSNIVFGLVINGEARAYPKRILAWHEMAIDRIGGVEMTVVYCTLCGTVMPFESDVGGRTFRFGTSGLLYRSNKLMFDEDSQSLWSTFEGAPVVGPLVGQNIRLRTRPVVTTTWKEWRLAHPATTVLSPDTGYQRDYAEGAAYREYFSNDRLMFRVSNVDRRLPNKAEVLVMQLAGGAAPDHRVPIAIHTAFLRRHPVYSLTAGGHRLVVITTGKGANRAYHAGDTVFPAQPAGTAITDAAGNRWHVKEPGLVREANPELMLPRVSAQRAFWFGWYAQFPETLLIK
jgi:hypothetical protein